MAETAPAIQLPPDGVGKVTGGFAIPSPAGDGSQLWMPASVLVDANGHEIGLRIVKALEGIEEQLRQFREATELEGLVQA
jgi:hypothetical protein